MKKSIYFSSDDQPQLHMSYCAFMDVLGFKELIQVSTDNDTYDALFRHIHAVVAIQVDNFEQNRQSTSPEPRWEIKVFTDNIVLGYPVSSSEGEMEFAEVVSELADYQLAMALEGFFVRGGLSSDKLFMDQYMVYGPALLEAYELESKQAREPRIVLSKQVYQAVEEFVKAYGDPQQSPHARNILIDPDGQAFINYLERVVSDEQDGTRSVGWHDLGTHKVKIEQKLQEYATNPLVWSKYYWLANYHDYFCQRYQSYDGYHQNYLVDPRLVKRSPRTFD